MTIPPTEKALRDEAKKNANALAKQEMLYAAYTKTDHVWSIRHNGAYSER